MVDIDAKTRLDFFNKRANNIQSALLQMDLDIKASQDQVVSLSELKKRAEEELVKARAEVVRAKAELEEEKNGRSGKA